MPSESFTHAFSFQYFTSCWLQDAKQHSGPPPNYSGTGQPVVPSGEAFVCGLVSAVGRLYGGEGNSRWDGQAGKTPDIQSKQQSIGTGIQEAKLAK